MDRLEGRVALVTGGTTGIGAAICEALQAMGRVAATYAGNAERAAAFTTRTGIKTYSFSVADHDACAAGVAAVTRDLGPIDIWSTMPELARCAPVATVYKRRPTTFVSSCSS